MAEQLSVALLGVADYGALQLLSLIEQHPRLQLTYVADPERAGRQLGELYPHLGLPSKDDGTKVRLEQNLEVHPLEIGERGWVLDPLLQQCDVIFLALPHGVAHRLAPVLIGVGCRVIDLSADYRFKSLADYTACYNLERSDQATASQAVYGLPELYRDRLPQANLVACPGCYSTASLLAIAPLLKQGLVLSETIILDAKLGASGAGRDLQPHFLLAEADNSVAAYSLARHRQTPEIEQICTELLSRATTVQFTPHLIPMVRGLLVTAYATLRDPGLVREDLITIYRAFYKAAPAVRVLPPGVYPQTKWTWGSHRCDLGIEVDSRTGRVIVVSAMDNLLKGGAGQAVQCLNLMMGWDEILGLPMMALYP